jgi:hypothetical protein
MRKSACFLAARVAETLGKAEPAGVQTGGAARPWRAAAAAVDGVAPIRAGAYPQTGAVPPAPRLPLPRAVRILPAYSQNRVAGW